MLYLLTPEDGLPDFAIKAESMICPHCRKCAVLLPLVIEDLSSETEGNCIVCPGCKIHVMDAFAFSQKYSSAVPAEMEAALREILSTCPVNPDCPPKPTSVPLTPPIKLLIHNIINNQEFLDAVDYQLYTQTQNIGLKLILECKSCDTQVLLPPVVEAEDLSKFESHITCPTCNKTLLSKLQFKNGYIPATREKLLAYLEKCSSTYSSNFPRLDCNQVEIIQEL